MLLVENALSEELPDSDSAPPSPSRTASPPLRRHAPAHPAHQPDPRATDYDKMLAACIGAVLTSLTSKSRPLSPSRMTPFDVIKTRLQTQAPRDPAFTPSPHQLPRSHPLATSPWPPPVASTSSAPPPPPLSTGAAAAKPAVCCNTKSYFNANAVPTSSSAHTAHHSAPASSDRSLLCRFDPRVARASLPGTGAHAVSTAPHQYLHNLASASASPTLALSSASASSESIAACLYPSSAAAPTHATVSLPFATTHSASFSPSSAPPSSAPPARHLTGFTDALVHIVRAEGATALWRGTGPALAMSVPGQVIYMVGYDWLRRTAFAHPPSWAQQRQGGGGGGGAYTTLVPLVAGSASRTVVAALLSPFELVRTRLQSQTPASRAPPLSALVRELRWSNAWRGLSSTLWRDVPFSGVYWAGYEAIKRGLTGGRGMGEAGRAGARAGPDESKWGEFAVAFVSGAGSGMIAATLTNPFDVIKTRRQALFASPSSSPPSSSAAPALEEVRTWPILRSIVQQEGYRGLWAGLTPRLAKVGPACGLMIGCYEAISSLSAAKLHAAAQPNDRQDARTDA
ncbi:hypothetical protein Rhopal_006522-T1 [Rhodotorula paludigena]|uniref:Mitochondrial carrier n=1 Tax=Rhodotorula paludigena TaxID=86838 RepID=A0AAV5GVE2_9BASI|nr:hypothetical protein Rhopal_006522-T1 [Rhodotorula paludigena]